MTIHTIERTPEHSRLLTPENVYHSNKIDWENMGAWNRKLYVADPIVDASTLTEEEQIAIRICKKYYYGLTLVQGGRGGGKSMFGWWDLWHMENYFGRQVGGDRLPRPGEFNNFHYTDINEICDQLDLMDEADKDTGDFHSAHSWLEGMAVMCDEFYRLVDKRRTQSKENQKVTDIVFQIRHYGIHLIGIAPDVNLLDVQRIQEYANAVATCVWMSNGVYSHIKIRPIETMGEKGVQRVAGKVDNLYLSSKIWGNAYHTKNPYGSRPHLNKVEK